MSKPLLIPGETCASLAANSRGGLLVDGRDFYRAFYEAACKAERAILMAGWQFSSSVELVRGDDVTSCDLPTTLIDFLAELCKRRPALNVYMLPWDSSPVFTFEREPLQRLRFRLKGHPRIHWKMDNCHPPGASHHQKLIAIDRSIAFVGGMDICDSRWDDRSHEAVAQYRCSGSRSYAPYHDVQAYVTGEAVDTLRGWFCERWKHASGSPLELVDCPTHAIEITPTFEVHAPRLGLARTLPKLPELNHQPPCDEVRELYHLHARAIGSAKHIIYIENQYFSSDEIARALETRMRQDTSRPIEIVMVLPQKSAGFKERISIGVYQAQLLEHLTKVAAQTGHHFGVYYQVAHGGTEDVPVFIHAKVLSVDDRFLLVSSANTSNRSMGYDTELGIAWEAPEATESLRTARMELLSEHIGVTREEAEALLGPSTRGLVQRLDELASARSHQLRIHGRNRDEKPGKLLELLIPERPVFDPHSEAHLKEGLLPERGTLLDRLLREPMSLFTQKARRLGKRKAS
jgi:phosphatidylserine/phosphatidylglycerophosphate/cardiolipin synthase-like enzyme